MCNGPACQHKKPVDWDSGDSLADMLDSGDIVAPSGLESVARDVAQIVDNATSTVLQAAFGTAPATHAAAVPSEYIERCTSCGGSGYWRGRMGYPCFKCKGQGKRSFKTSAATREK